MSSLVKSSVKSLVKKAPLIGPVVGGVGVALDIKDIVESSTPIGAAKKMGSRVIQECTPPEIFYTGKCLWLVGSAIATIYTGGSPMAAAAFLSGFRSIIKG